MALARLKVHNKDSSLAGISTQLATVAYVPTVNGAGEGKLIPADDDRVDDPALQQAVVLRGSAREGEVVALAAATATAGGRVGQSEAVRLEDEEAALGQHAADGLEARLR